MSKTRSAKQRTKRVREGRRDPSLARQTWGIKPLTHVKANAKLYNRKLGPHDGVPLLFVS